MSRGGNDTCGMLWMLEHFGKYGGTMNRALTKADIVEAIYEKTDRNRADVKNTVEILLGLMKQAIKTTRKRARAAILKRMRPLRSLPARWSCSVCLASSVRN